MRGRGCEAGLGGGEARVVIYVRMLKGEESWQVGPEKMETLTVWKAGRPYRATGALRGKGLANW